MAGLTEAGRLRFLGARDLHGEERSLGNVCDPHADHDHMADVVLSRSGFLELNDLMLPPPEEVHRDPTADWNDLAQAARAAFDPTSPTRIVQLRPHRLRRPNPEYLRPMDLFLCGAPYWLPGLDTPRDSSGDAMEFVGQVNAAALSDELIGWVFVFHSSQSSTISLVTAQS